MTFVLFSFPIFSFFTANGRVKTIRATVRRAKIRSYHLNGSGVFDMKMNGTAAIPAQMVVRDIVIPSIIMQSTRIPSQNHGKFDVIKLIILTII